MDLKTAFHSDSYHLEDLISTAPDLRPYFTRGSAFSLSQNRIQTTSLEPYHAYCERTKQFIDALHAIEDSSTQILQDFEWYKLYKMILCDEYLYNRTHDDKGKIKASNYFHDIELAKLFSFEDIKNFVFYKNIVRNDMNIGHNHIPTITRVLYYADRLRFATGTIHQISNLSAIPDNTRILLNTLLDQFDRIHERCDIPQIDIEDTIRDHIANFLDMPVADPKISFIGHPVKPKESP